MTSKIRIRLKAYDHKLLDQSTSEIVETATELLLPMIILFGIYVFINGHLSPGGGFQGGMAYGSTNEFGNAAVEHPLSIQP